VTTRRRGALAALAAIDDARVLAVPLDVADAVARKAALVAALARFGRIDVLANIAGRGSLGAVEELASEQ
jgi:NAD(P)-dependent dehydrogenase (short-subunit alcohol dehydrogenase family)